MDNFIFCAVESIDLQVSGSVKVIFVNGENIFTF